MRSDEDVQLRTATSCAAIQTIRLSYLFLFNIGKKEKRTSERAPPRLSIWPLDLSNTELFVDCVPRSGSQEREKRWDEKREKGYSALPKTCWSGEQEMTRKLNFCLSTYSVLILLAFSTQAFAANQAKTKSVITTTTIASSTKNTNSTEQIEGSANIPGRLADIEVNGSGYPTDDEDGDDVHGSGKPPSAPAATSTTTAESDVKHTSSPSNVVVTPIPTTMPSTTASFKPPVHPKPKPAANDKELKVDDDDDDDDDDEDEDDDDEDDEDFADENIHNDDEFFTTTTTTDRPVIIVTTTTPRSYVAHSTNPPRNQPPLVTSTVSSGPFSPFHETMTNGFYAAIAGGVLVAVITAILLVLFVVFRIRKKDEGSYALDEPKQARPYNTYAYTKASTKEFYA